MIITKNANVLITSFIFSFIFFFRFIIVWLWSFAAHSKIYNTTYEKSVAIHLLKKKLKKTLTKASEIYSHTDFSVWMNEFMKNGIDNE